MNKKASITKVTQWIVHLVLLMMVISIFLGVILKLKDNKLHNLRVEAREYAFTRDTVLASPEQIRYKYLTKEKILLKINKERCLIQSFYKEHKDTTPVTYFCTQNEQVQINEMFEEKGVLLEKNE